MPSDWQRQKVYDAESFFKFTLDNDHYLNQRMGDLDVERVRAIVEDVFEVVEERYGYRTNLTDVRPSTARRYIATATRSTGVLHFNPGYIIPLVVIHEACHLATDDHVPGHGVEFNENMLLVMEALFDAPTAKLLRVAFDLKGVQYDYEQRAAYTRKRARWACGSDGFRVTTTLRRSPSLLGKQPRFVYKTGYREPDGVLLAKAGASEGADGKPEATDVLVPYDTIAYIERW